MGGRDPRVRARVSLRKGSRRPRRARPVDAGGLARLAGGGASTAEQGVPRERVLVAGRERPGSAEDRGELPGGGGVRGGSGRGRSARHGSAVALRDTVPRARARVRRALLLG